MYVRIDNSEMWSARLKDLAETIVGSDTQEGRWLTELAAKLVEPAPSFTVTPQLTPFAV